MKQKTVASPVQVIERMMSLLDALARNDAPMNLKQLAAETSLHPSTAHRILNAMTRNRYVDRIAHGSYRLGIRLFELGGLVHTRIGIRNVALPYMQQLHQQLGETVRLSIRLDERLVYVEHAHSGNQIDCNLQSIGATAPLHLTAAGKLFLASESADYCAEYAKHIGLPSTAEEASMDASGLLREIAAVRELGYAYDGAELGTAAAAVAAGINDESGAMIAALCVSAPLERYNQMWASAVKQAAERISRAIGNPMDAAR